MNNRAIWRFSPLGAKWAFWVFILLTFINMVAFVPDVYKLIERNMDWRHQEVIELMMVSSPALVGAFILFITGFNSEKDIWRMSARGLGIASGVWCVGTIASFSIFFPKGTPELSHWYLLFGVPISFAAIPFIHSGFIAARYDKRTRS